MNHIQNTDLRYLGTIRNPWQVSRSNLAIQYLISWRESFAGSDDFWLRELIAKAFMRLKSRNMDQAPAVELITVVAEEWVEIIGDGMDESDRDRVIIAFRSIFRECRKWPQPADLIKRLPTRIKRNPTENIMEAPLTDEQHARGKAAFDEILASFE